MTPPHVGTSYTRFYSREIPTRVRGRGTEPQFASALTGGDTPLTSPPPPPPCSRYLGQWAAEKPAAFSWVIIIIITTPTLIKHIMCEVWLSITNAASLQLSGPPGAI